MNLGVLRATVKKEPDDTGARLPDGIFFIGNTPDRAFYTLLGAWLAYHCLFGGSLSPASLCRLPERRII